MKLKLKLESEPEPEPGQSDGSSEIPRIRLRKPAAGNVFHCAPLVLLFNAILFFINNILYDARVICQKYTSKFYCYFTFYFSIKLSILLFKVLGIGIFFFYQYTILHICTVYNVQYCIFKYCASNFVKIFKAKVPFFTPLCY